MNTEKQIQCWISSAQEDLKTAKLLLVSKRILHGLFFCHLVIEMALKASVVKQTNTSPPRSHNLIYLAEKADLKLPEKQEIFLGILIK